VFAFGLVAFGFLGMGPVTIAVDSFGPVSDNAQSIYELSLIESRPDTKDVVKKEYGIAPILNWPSTIWNPETARAIPSKPQPNPC